MDAIMVLPEVIEAEVPTAFKFMWFIWVMEPAVYLAKTEVLRHTLQRSRVLILVKVIGGRQEGHPVQKCSLLQQSPNKQLGTVQAPWKRGVCDVKPHHQLTQVEGKKHRSEEQRQVWWVQIEDFQFEKLKLLIDK